MASLVSFYTDEPIKPRDSDIHLHLEQRPMAEADEFKLVSAEPGVAYVRHPESSVRLLPLADYHSQIMYEKTNEAIIMLTALGASSIDLSYSNKISDSAKADVEILFGMISFGGDRSKSEENTVIFHARGEGSDPRALPPLLWIEQPAWRGIIDGRLHSGLQEFTLAFTYDHRNGVDAELASKVRRFGLRVGGEFRKSHKVAFTLAGEFPALMGGLTTGSLPGAVEGAKLRQEMDAEYFLRRPSVASNS